MPPQTLSFCIDHCINVQLPGQSPRTQFTQGVTQYYGANMVGFAYPDTSEPDGKKADVWFIDGPSPYGGPAATTVCHLAWRAEIRAQVDAA